MDHTDEKEKLLGVVVASQEVERNASKDSNLPVAVAMVSKDTMEEREWDGHLLQCCGSWDRHGLSAFASTLLCTPCVVAHNIKAAMPGTRVWTFVFVLVVSFIMRSVYYSQVHFREVVCHGPPPPHRRPDELEGPLVKGPLDLDFPGNPDPATKTFLTGATFNADFLKDIPEYDDANIDEPTADVPVEESTEPEAGFTVLVNGQKMHLNEFDATNAQIQEAKDQAQTSITQLMGRKLLHKHDDDDDDDDHHEKEKKDKLKMKKKCKKQKKDKAGHDDPKIEKAETLDAHHAGPKHHPEGPEHGPVCHAATRDEIILWWCNLVCWMATFLMGFSMRSRMRAALNIKGTRFQDYWSWACCMPCAICQETRTLTKNNVVNGVWHSPTVFTPVKVAPAPQVMEAKGKEVV